MFMNTTYKKLVGGGGGGSKSSWIQKQCDENNNLFRLPTLVLHKWTNYLEKLLSLRITFKRSYKCKADIRTEQVKHH